MISSRAAFLAVVAVPLLTTACSLDTDQFTFQDAPAAAGSGGSGGAGSGPFAGAAGTPSGGGNAGAAGTQGQIGGAAGSGGLGEAGKGGAATAGAAGDAGSAGDAGAAGEGGASAGGEGGVGGVGGEGGAAGEGGGGGAGGAVGQPCSDQNFGEQRCSGKTIETCDGTDWEPDPVACPLACIDIGVLAACKVCEPGTASCAGNRLEICAADGRGQDASKELTCGESPGTEDLPECNAAAKACQQCVTGDKICVGATSRTCGAGGVYPLSGGEECKSAALCTPEGCLPPLCQPGTSTCDAAGVRFCKGDLTGYGDAEACAAGTSCVEGKGCVECPQEDGTRFCEGDTLIACKGGRKSPEAECAKGQCSDTQQKCLACLDGAFQCAGQVLSACESSEFVVKETCAAGSFCNAVAGGCVACAPGSVRCEGLELQSCNDAGVFEKKEACTTVCDAAGNECDECLPNESRCHGADLQICNDRGKFEVAEKCGSADLCDASNALCKPPACGTNGRRCAGHQPQRCNDSRTDWEDVGAACEGACLDIAGDTEQGCVDAVAIASGPSATCAIVGSSRRLVCWGAFGGAIARLPALRRDLRDVDDVSFGANFVCALHGGAVSCWGSNASGQLGRDPATLASSTAALEVTIAPGKAAVAISAVGSGMCASLASGELYCWGQKVNTSTFGHVPTKVVASNMGALSSGLTTRCGVSTVKPGGNAFCWGNDTLGKLGNGAPVLDANEPSTPVLGPAVVGTPLVNVEAIAVGGGHACAIAASPGVGSGNVYCWGSNVRGALGMGGTDSADHPKASLLSITAKQIGAGTNHACAVDGTGGVTCWGSSELGAHGSATYTVPSPAKVTVGRTLDLALGNTHTCALVKGNQVYCWGNNASTQLGSVVSGATFSVDPVKVTLP